MGRLAEGFRAGPGARGIYLTNPRCPCSRPDADIASRCAGDLPQRDEGARCQREPHDAQRYSAWRGPAADALRRVLALTRWAAVQYSEEAEKGTLTAGKLADLVILDRNPLTVAPYELHAIDVVQTIKEGEPVWTRE